MVDISAARTRRVLAMATVIALLATGCYDWTQFLGGPDHSGWNRSETKLSVSNVSGLHRIWRATLPAAADGAPAVLRNVATADGTKTLAFVTTRAGHIVAIDLANGSQVWSKAFGPGACLINNETLPCYTTSSPAVDPGRAFVYSYGLDGYVHKLAVGDGTETTTDGWPQLITTKGFDEKGSSQLTIATDRAGVSRLYMMTAGYPGDKGDYQGHLVTIDLATGVQRVWNTLCSDQAVHFVTAPGSPDCPDVQAGVWARAGTIYDASTDKLYISSGNGEYSPATHRWGDSVVVLHPDGTPDANGDPIDAYTPTNYQFLQDFDLDLGSTLPAILPVPADSAVPHLGLMAGKDSKLRLLNLDDLSGQGGPGHLGGEIGPIISVPQGGVVLTQPAVWINPADGTIWAYVANSNGVSAYTVAISGTGQPSLVFQWTITPGSTTPLVANGVLYLSRFNNVRAHDALTGAFLWQNPVLLATLHWQTPVVENGVLLMEDGNAHLDAFSL